MGMGREGERKVFLVEFELERKCGEKEEWDESESGDRGENGCCDLGGVE